MYIQSVKRFVSASTPKGLEKEMLRNNIKRNRFHDYQIVYDGSTWFAWYLDDRTDPLEAVKELNDATNN